jgi:hypothetical protein
MFNLFKKKKKEVIGRLERINIPSLEIYNVLAKIDTGAYRGAIHADNIKVVRRGGKRILKFTVLDPEHPEFNNVVHETKKFKKKKVRTTQSDYRMRYIIPVIIEIAGTKIKAELGLTDRSDLRNPILIGRKALRKFIIDVSRVPEDANEFINN